LRLSAATFLKIKSGIETKVLFETCQLFSASSDLSLKSKNSIMKNHLSRKFFLISHQTILDCMNDWICIWWIWYSLLNLIIIENKPKKAHTRFIKKSLVLKIFIDTRKKLFYFNPITYHTSDKR
jgi:hypothetical protein